MYEGFCMANKPKWTKYKYTIKYPYPIYIKKWNID